jgi:hypothetical protein
MGCDNGIYQFSLLGETISYTGIARSGDSGINDFQFFQNQSYYALFGNFGNCKFYLGTYDGRSTFTSSDSTYITLSSCTGASNIAFFYTKNALITS